MSFRGDRQLLQLVFRACGWSGSSRGMREYLRSALPALAEANPQTAFRVVRRQNRHPVLRAYYRNGNEHVVNVENLSVQEIAEHVQALRAQHGRRVAQFRRPVVRRAEANSAQGEWTEHFSLEGVRMQVEHMFLGK